jgi:hypothetical protein
LGSLKLVVESREVCITLLVRGSLVENQVSLGGHL